MKQVFLQPGEVAWSETPVLFRTVLGSCISVCLWDRRLKIGGLTHFVLPRGVGDARFGEVAIPQLIAELRSLGCKQLEAKVFGGASVLAGGAVASVGDGNTKLALALLHEHGIPVVAQRTGGELGIVIRYLCTSGEVMLREITATLAA